MLINAQPFVVQHAGQMLAIGHNGTLTNARNIRQRLEEEGSIFQSTMDTEVIVHLMARQRGADLLEALSTALGEVKGSYSLVLSTADKVIAARDPHGFRPLCLGQLNGSWVAASETCGRLLAGGGTRRNRGDGRRRPPLLQTLAAGAAPSLHL
jgi:amidophosphoribosyltransferase